VSKAHVVLERAIDSAEASLRARISSRFAGLVRNDGYNKIGNQYEIVQFQIRSIRAFFRPAARLDAGSVILDLIRDRHDEIELYTVSSKFAVLL